NSGSGVGKRLKREQRGRAGVERLQPLLSEIGEIARLRQQRGVTLLLRRCFVLFGNRALLLRDPALPVRDAGEDQRDKQTGRQAAGENVAAPGGRLPALLDKPLCPLSWAGRSRWAGCNPALRLLQQRGAQQQAAGLAGGMPALRSLAECGVPSDPADVGSQ